MTTQYGFFIDSSRCTGCKTCELACKDFKDLGPEVSFRRIYEYAGFDGWDDPLRKTYPLQLTGFHYKARTHSSYGNIDVLQQACPQEVWINPIDAQARGIRHGDTVRVFNNNGEMLIAAKVTPRILPGVTAIGQGAWLKADMFGDRVDHGGSINILTSHRPSPLAKGNPSHSNLVQIEKV